MPESGPADRHPNAEGTGRPVARRVAVATALLLAAALGAVLVRSRMHGRPGAPTAFEARRSVAVLGFKNLSGRPDTDWISTALAEILLLELAVGEKLRTIAGEDVARMRIDLSLAVVDRLTRQDLARVRENLRADLVVLGSYAALGEKLPGDVRLDARVQDTATGETLASVTETGSRSEIPDLVARASVAIRRKLGVGDSPAAETGVVRASLPLSPEATRPYSEGLSKLRLFDALSARDLLEKAIVADPTYPLAHSALAEAWSALGYDARAREEAKKAFDLSAGLSREERLSIEGRYHGAKGEWGKTVEIYRALWASFPDGLDYGLRLAAAQVSAGRGKDALATAASLRRLAPEDPRIDLVEAQAAEALSDFRREQVAAASAVLRGRARGARLLVAQARLAEWWAFRNLGQLDQATRAAEEARRIYAAVGDRGGVARALNALATVLRQQGDLDRSKALDEESLAVFRDIGDKKRVCWALNNVGQRLLDQGRLAGARPPFEESLALGREIGDRSGVTRVLNSLGTILYQQGSLRQARGTFEEALAFARETGERRAEAWCLNNLGGVAEAQGDLDGARKKFEQSLSISDEIGDKRGEAWSLDFLAGVLIGQGDLGAAGKASARSLETFRQIGVRRSTAFPLYDLAEVLRAGGDLREARRRHEEALKLWIEVGDEWNQARSRLVLAALSIDEGRPAEAVAPALEAAEIYRREGAAGHEGSARALLARALLADRKPHEAEAALQRGLVLARRSESLWGQLGVAIAAARVRAEQGQPAQAVKSLRDVLARATQAGHVPLQLEARLVLGQVEMAYGSKPAGRELLEVLEQDAGAKGFGLLADQAAADRR